MLVIFGGIVIHAPLSVGLGTLFPDLGLLIKSWKEILLLIAGSMAIILVIDTNSWRMFMNDVMIRIAALYTVLHLLMAAALLTGPTATLAGLAIDLRYVVFFVLVYVCLYLAPFYRKRFLQVAGVGAVIVVGFGVLQLFLPADILKYIGYGKNTIQPYLTVDENPDYIRINSTLRGPNPLGAYAVIVLSLLAAAIVKGKVALRRSKEMVYIGLGLVSTMLVLWVSYSRSALLAVGAALGIVVLIAGRQWLSRRVWIIGCVLLCALAGGIIVGREHSLVTNVILHENPDGGSAVSSNDGHLESLKIGTQRMVRQPVGAGIGSTGSASLFTEEPLILENQYLFIAHEVGWLGLGLFIALFCLICRRLWHSRRDWVSLGVFASGSGLALIGLLQPVWVDDTVAIIWWGLAAIAIASGGQHVRRTTKQKTT